MPAHNLLSRVPRHFIKTVTFTTTGDGAVGSVTLGTVTGRILVTHLSAYCSTTLVGAATLELGVAGNTAGLIAQIADATDLVATEFWNDATPTDVLTAAAIVDKLVGSDILIKVASTTISAGVIEFSMLWLPMSSVGNIA